MSENRYNTPGGDFEHEDFRRQRNKLYSPAAVGEAMQQSCQYFVETLDELIYRHLADCDITGDMSRVEMSFSESDGFSCVRREIRRIARPNRQGNLYILKNETIDLFAPARSMLITKHYGIATTNIVSANGEENCIYNLSKWEKPGTTFSHAWLGGISIGANRHEILEYDMDEILDNLVMFDDHLKNRSAH